MIQQKFSFPLFLRLLREYPVATVITVLSALATSLTAVFSTQLIGKAVDYMVGVGNVNVQSLFQIIIMLAVLYLVGAISTWFVTAWSSKIALSIARDLRHKVFEKLGKLPLSYFDQTAHGDILSQFTNDLDSISDALSLSLVSVLTGVVTIITLLFMMFYYSSVLSMVIILLTPLNFIAARIVTKASQSTFEQQQEMTGQLSGLVTETVQGQKTIQGLGYELPTLHKFYTANQSLKETGTKAHFASAMVNPSTRVVDHISYIAVGVVGAFLAINSSGMTIGLISMFLVFSSQFAKPFNDISGILANLQTAAASLRRIRGTLSEKEEVQDSEDALVLGQVAGKIDFSKVSFSYDDFRPLLRDLTIEAKSGQLIALVGPTGAGKTTIVNLLMRFYELDEGSISIDDTNIIRYTKNSLRRAFGMVLQDTWLFHGTIAENIGYGRPDASLEEIQKAAKAAYADDFISRFPEGYQTVIVEDGGNLSSGQKQLLTIARVMLTNPSMLILDEATSSIDSLTEAWVQQAFLKMMKGRTSFVIAHRLSTIVKADTILVLDQGKVIEIGTHQKLLEDKGFYYHLYHSQFEPA